MIKTLGFIFTISFFSGTASAQILDFNFNNARHCQGEFSYEKVFLLDGRRDDQILVRDQEATAFIGQVRHAGRVTPVSYAYSIPMFENYIHYDSMKENAKKLSVVLAKVENSAPGPEFRYRLLLVVTEGNWKGLVFAEHSANVDVDLGSIESDRFRCWSE